MRAFETTAIAIAPAIAIPIPIAIAIAIAAVAAGGRRRRHILCVRQFRPRLRKRGRAAGPGAQLAGARLAPIAIKLALGGRLS